jgi:hypothetical protein
MNYSQEARDLDFAYKVRHALNESSEALPPVTLDRLAKARQIALSRKKEEPIAVQMFQKAFASNGSASFQNPLSLLHKLGIAFPLMVLAVCLMFLHEHEQQRNIHDLAELDTEVLVDELPPDAYLDKGFSAYLARAED